MKKSVKNFVQKMDREKAKRVFKIGPLRQITLFLNYARAGKFYLLSIRGTKVQTLPYKTRKIN